MKIFRFESIILFFGDIFFFLLSLYITLVLRYGNIPSRSAFSEHLFPFLILFIFWVIIFFIVGLYEKHTLILKNRLPSIILNALIVNAIIAVSFFYFLPYFKITPKTNLFIYLIVSSLIFVFWRSYLYSKFSSKKKQRAMLIGSGSEISELKKEVNENNRYNLFFVSSVDLDQVEKFDFQEEVIKKVYSENIEIVVCDLRNKKLEPFLANLYGLVFSKVKFIDMHKIYEDIFDRIPLSIIEDSWFLENISISSKFSYDFLKRLADLIIAFSLGLTSLIIYPLIYLAIKLENKGKVFFLQDRIGKNNKLITIYKFRSMDNEGRVTKVGNFLRKTRLDELPQLWNVLKGDLSVIGPRPEIPDLVKLYEKEIPYYNIRHLIKPGLSGWAQIYHLEPPKFKVGYHETKTKLSYDLYYIKNRYFFLDLIISIKTLKVFFTRSGV